MFQETHSEVVLRLDLAW